MRLKTLEMQGFKSFPERTKIDFERGMTVIVGPNGSGKSNISDAIRWVLGETSAKSIRGGKMEDVIFGGTDARRPMGFAEVTLIFDNRDGEALPLDFDEVAITRRYFRSGESEYEINRRPTRLRDIQELFMNTGLGKSGYSIIGQGRIAEIISKKSEDRRAIFEEAAGIAKYRHRKVESERKLAEAQGNLLRVGDILSELEGRVEPLAAESEKARRYLELYGRKKSIDIAVWVHDLNNVQTETEKAEGEVALAKSALDMVNDSLGEFETQIERLHKSQNDGRIEAESLRAVVNEAVELRHDIERREALLHNDIEHIKAEIAREGDLQASRKSALLIGQSTYEKLSEESEKASDARKDASKNLASTNVEIDTLRTEVGAVAAKKRAAETESERENTALVADKLTLSGLQGTHSSTKERETALEAQRAALSERLEIGAAELTGATDQSKAYKTKLESAVEEVSKLRESDDRIVGEVEPLRAETDTLRAKNAAYEQQIIALRRMEEHFEGYSNAVRTVMSKAKSGELRGIIGPLSSVISVEKAHTVAIETALGAALQNIVVDDEESAKRAITALKISGAGRATFYPVTTMVPQSLDADPDELEACAGYIGIAAELVGCDEKYYNIIDNLLRRTVVCDNLDNASELSRRFDRRFRVVTLDGQVVNAGGSYTGGSAGRDSGILSRKSEIAELENKSLTNTKKLSEINKKIAVKNEELAAVRAKIDAGLEQVEILTTLYTSEITGIRVITARLESEREQLTALTAQIEELLGAASTVSGKRAQLEAQISERDGKIAALAEKISSLNAEGAALIAKIERLTDTKNTLLLTLTAQERDAAALERQLAELTASIAATTEAIKVGEQNIAMLSGKTSSGGEELARRKAEFAATADKVKAAEDKIAALFEDGQKIEARLTALRQSERDAARRKESLAREYDRMEGRLQKASEQREVLTAKLWEEYELSYSDAAAQNALPLTESTRPEAVTEQNRLRRKIGELGSVNVGAIEEYKEVKGRYDFLSAQVADLTASQSELTGIIFELEGEMRLRFADTFERVNINFRTVFAELFGGGHAELSLTDPTNILESGIEINVAPPGKIIKNLMSLSGGEQVFVAIALFFAILRISPAPFCLLDEIEAALDEVNVARFAEYARNYSDRSQFIIITHRRGTMEVSDTLYGVTMPERGVSRVLTLNVSEVESKLKIT